MNSYKVYISETKAITISADRWKTNGDGKLLLFVNEERKENIAVFNVNNILGWVEE